MQIHLQSEFPPGSNSHIEQGLQRVFNRLVRTMYRHELIRQTTNYLRETLQSDRVFLYYFYRQWRGQVIFESLTNNKFSILGLQGADNCFNDEYASLYLAGRIRAISDIELEPIQTVHRDFLHSIQVRAYLVVPILNPGGLCGLLVAHHCQQPYSWSLSDIDLMQTAAQLLATDSSIPGEI